MPSGFAKFWEAQTDELGHIAVATSVPGLIHPVARPNFLDLATMKILKQRSSNFKHY